jgi:hypothetical protein
LAIHLLLFLSLGLLPLIALHTLVLFVNLKETQVLIDLLRVELKLNADLLQLLHLESHWNEVFILLLSGLNVCELVGCKLFTLFFNFWSLFLELVIGFPKVRLLLRGSKTCTASGLLVMAIARVLLVVARLVIFLFTTFVILNYLLARAPAATSYISVLSFFWCSAWILRAISCAKVVVAGVNTWSLLCLGAVLGSIATSTLGSLLVVASISTTSLVVRVPMMMGFIASGLIALYSLLLLIARHFKFKRFIASHEPLGSIN